MPCCSGFPLIERIVNGPAHAIANLSKAIFFIATNTDVMKFSKEHRHFEMSRGRVYDKVPPWCASKDQVAAVDRLLRDLKVPKGWPPLPDGFEAVTTLKLEQTLALAGDVGKYLLEALNIQELYHTHMQAYLGALQDCQQKTPVKAVSDIMWRFTEAAAALEALLPAYWNSATKHNGLHLDRFQRDWSCFWATNELYHERLNGKMKRLSKHGVRNRMATLSQNWDIFQAANDWLLEDDVTTTYEVRPILCYTSLLLWYEIIAVSSFSIAPPNTVPRSLLHLPSPPRRRRSSG